MKNKFETMMMIGLVILYGIAYWQLRFKHKEMTEPEFISEFWEFYLIGGVAFVCLIYVGFCIKNGGKRD